MAIKTYIEDGTGSGNVAKVTPSGYLYTQEAPYPPVGEDTKLTIYRERLTLNNDGTTFDARVNGSVNPQSFWIQAESDKDIYITSVSFLIADAGATLNEFGNIGALANGCRVYYEDENGIINVGTGLISNFEFIRLCLGQPSFGTGTTAFQAGNIAGTSEGYIPVLDFRNFGFRWGLRLKAGSLNKLVLEVNDDVTGVDAFNVIAYGFRRNPD
jgi:hypothetical protein